jgi:hypothetical protein
MNTFKRITLALFAFAAIVSAQTKLASTTLSQAISTADPSTSVVGLVGGTANSLNNIVFLAACNQTDMAAFNRVSAPVKLYIDWEAMDVQAINTTTCAVNVLRGTDGTSSLPHASGATVYIGTPDKFAGFDIPGGTACTAGTGADLYTPRINLTTGTVEDCLNGRWVINSINRPGLGDPQVTYDKPFTALSTWSGPNSVASNTSTDVNGQFWFSQIMVPANSTLTGACLLNGSTVGTDKWIFYLWDKAGNVIANTALAGTTTATASKYQCINFAATVQVIGPQTYFVGVQGNGTTDTMQTYAANSAPNNYGVNTASGTFGTAAAITPTVTFAANKGPIMALY